MEFRENIFVGINDPYYQKIPIPLFRNFKDKFVQPYYTSNDIVVEDTIQRCAYLKCKLAEKCFIEL